MWLPEPPKGTPVVLAFDGSETGDWSAIKGETVDGLLFTPRRVDGERPAIWDPSASPTGRMPRGEVDATMDRLFDRFDVRVLACDPHLWGTEIETWATRHGEKRVLRWEMSRPKVMHAATERFLVDLREGRLRHDGCPITTRHVLNARMAHRRDATYLLAKPTTSRKIDAAVTSVVAHENAALERASGWGSEEALPPLVFGF